jgi:hypothetical protein
MLPDVTLPYGLGTPRELCFQHASELLFASAQYRTKFSFKYNCGITTAFPWLVAFTLVPQLDGSPRVAEPFTKACQYMWEYVSKLDVLRYSLRSLEVLALIHKVQIPADAVQYFQDLDIDDGVLENVPITLMMTELPSTQTPNSADSSTEVFNKAKFKMKAATMRELLARWNDLTFTPAGLERPDRKS